MTSISLVTGANRGLGRNTAVSIARLGGDVIITYRGNDVQAREVVAEIEALGRRAIALQLDIARIDSFPVFGETLRAALLQTWDRDTFDHLINNAGHGEFAMIGETTESQFDGLFDVHVKGVFFLVQNSFASYRRWGADRELLLRLDPGLLSRFFCICRRERSD